MRKFQEWVNLRENAPNQMDQNGETPLAHATAQTAQSGAAKTGGATAATQPQPGGAGDQEEVSKLVGAIKTHFDMFTKDLARLHNIRKPVALEITEHIFKELERLGIKKQVMMQQVHNNF